MNPFNIIPPQTAWVNSDGTPTKVFYKFIANLFVASGGGGDLTVEDVEVLTAVLNEDEPQDDFSQQVITSLILEPEPQNDTDLRVLVALGEPSDPFLPDQTAFLAEMMADPVDAGAFGGSVITKITGGTGITVSTTASAATISLATIPNVEILANISGGIAAPIPNTMTAILDATMGAARGDIIYRGAANWAALVLGGTGAMVRSNGTDITWANSIGYAGDQSYQTAGWATGDNFSSNCSLYTSATTQQASEREILAGAYFVNSLGGNQTASPQRDKVAFSAQIETNGTNSGDQWAVYPVAVINSGAFSSQGTTTYGLEVDVNNNSGVNLANFPTIGGHVAQAYGIALTGSSANLCTAAVWVTGVGPQWDKAFWITGASVIGTAGFRDESNSPTSVQILGSHTYGIDMSSASFSQSPMNWPSAATATSATAGGATALPATPAGYKIESVNGTKVKTPYYSV